MYSTNQRNWLCVFNTKKSYSVYRQIKLPKDEFCKQLTQAVRAGESMRAVRATITNCKCGTAAAILFTLLCLDLAWWTTQWDLISRRIFVWPSLEDRHSDGSLVWLWLLVTLVPAVRGRGVARSEDWVRHRASPSRLRQLSCRVWEKPG